MRVAMLAPPWLPIPPKGYGGIEYVVYYLVTELARLNVEVELFTVAETPLKAHKNHWFYEKAQYQHIHKPLYDIYSIPVTHTLFCLDYIKKVSNFDIIHDHNFYLGPPMMAYLNPAYFPRVLHTLHGPLTSNSQVAQGLPDNRDMYALFPAQEHLYFNGISKAQLDTAPPELRTRLVDVVYNAVDTADFPFEKDKSDYFITLAEFRPDKGQAVAARFCEELGYTLRMAGIVEGITTPRKLMVELANANGQRQQGINLKYFRHEVLPRLIPGQIEYVGNLANNHKMQFLSNAKALLFPIQWDEPFGMAVIEALACGTPVVAFNRGAMPEIIEHGVNGFLAKTDDEFKDYMTRTSEIDPAACRQSVEERFSAQVMARTYLERYRQIINA